MYNGIGLQTARGSGTNGYIQTNKFFVRPKTNKISTESKGFDDNQGTAGVSKKPNKAILEHDRKRQIQLKLVVLEDKLIDQGYTDEEIAPKLDEARKTLEAADKAEEAFGVSAVVLHDKRVSDTQTHQIAARKEKQMETFKAALGIGSAGKNQRPGNHSDHEEGNDYEKLENIAKNGDNASDKVLVGDTRDEQYEIEKGVKYKKNEVRRDGIKSSKLQKKNDSSDSDSSREHVKKSRKKHEKIRGSHYHNESSSDSEIGRGLAKQNRKKHQKIRQTSDSDDKSDSDVQKIRRKSPGKHKKSRRHDSEDSDYADEKDDKSRWRGGLDDETYCLDETRDTAERFSYGSRDTREKRKFADDKEDDLPEAKSRRLIYEKEIERSKDLPRDTKTETNSKSHRNKVDQMDEYKMKRSGGEREDRRKIKDEDDHRERKQSRDEDDEKERNYKRGEDDKEDQRKSKDEDRQGRKHKRDDDEEETYKKHDTTKEHQHGRHGRQQEERHDNRSHEKDRPSDHSKRARYEDSRSNERYDNEKRKDRRSRR